MIGCKYVNANAVHKGDNRDDDDDDDDDNNNNSNNNNKDLSTEVQIMGNVKTKLYRYNSCKWKHFKHFSRKSRACTKERK